MPFLSVCLNVRAYLGRDFMGSSQVQALIPIMGSDFVWSGDLYLSFELQHGVAVCRCMRLRTNYFTGYHDHLVLYDRYQGTDASGYFERYQYDPAEQPEEEANGEPGGEPPALEDLPSAS